MKNIVLYAVEHGAPRPLISCDPGDESRFFKVSAAGVDFARQKMAQGVAVPPLRVVLEHRETDAGGVALAKQEFTLLDPASFAAKGKPVKDLNALLNSSDAKSNEKE